MNYVKELLKQFRKDIITVIKVLMAMLFLFSVIILIIVAAWMYETHVKGEYLPGRDTVELFGNKGRYHILESSGLYTLRDEKKGISIEENIYNYFDKNEDGKLYVIGKKGYTILNYKNDKCKQADKLEDFTKEEQNIFNQIKNMELEEINEENTSNK